jgi:amino acid transporter
MAPVTHLSGWFGTPLNVSDLSGLFGYIGMAMFMFVGCELVTPMARRLNRRTGPSRAMALGLLGVASCMFIYGAAINRQVENVVLDAANVHLLDTPMAIPAFAERVMGHAGQYWLGVGLLLAGCATITLMAAVPRIIYGMALDGALPRFLTWLHPRFKTPVIAIAIGVAIPCLHAWYLNGNIDRIVPLILAAVCAWGVAYLLVTLRWYCCVFVVRICLAPTARRGSRCRKLSPASGLLSPSSISPRRGWTAAKCWCHLASCSA